jgi:hypothetical protein
MKNGKLAIIATIVFLIIYVPCCSLYRAPALYGKVVDIETGRPVPDVKVSVEYLVTHFQIIEMGTKVALTKYRKTDSNGIFELSPVLTLVSPHMEPFGSMVEFEKEGYTNITVSGDCFSSGCKDGTIAYYSDNSKKISWSNNLVQMSKLYDVPKVKTTYRRVAPPGPTIVTPMPLNNDGTNQ